MSRREREIVPDGGTKERKGVLFLKFLGGFAGGFVFSDSALVLQIFAACSRLWEGIGSWFGASGLLVFVPEYVTVAGYG